MASASSTAASAAPLSWDGGSRRARPSSRSSALRTPRAANSRASSGCTPACSSAKAARGGTSRRCRVGSVTAPPARCGWSAPASARPGAATGLAAGRHRFGRCARRTASAALPAPARARASIGPASSACQASHQAAQSSPSAGSRRRSSTCRSAAGAVAAGRRPQWLSQTLLTVGRPAASRWSFSAWVYSSICTSFCSRRIRRALRWSGSQALTLRPITRSSDAVARPSNKACVASHCSGAA